MVSFSFGKKNDDVMKNSVIIAIASLLANAFNYLFYMYTAKVLGPEKYGIFGTLLSIYFIFFFLTNIVNYVIIEYVAYFKAKIQLDKTRRLFDFLIKAMTLAGFVIFLILLVISGKLANLIHLNSSTPIIALGLFLWAYIVFNTILGMLNGLQKFAALGTGRVIDGFFTLLFGIIFLNLNMGIAGGMFALFFAALLTIPFVIVPLRFLFNIQPAKIGDIGIFSYVAKALIPSIFIAIMLNIDVILAKIFLSPIEAGYFAAASLMGKLVFFISVGVLSVIFPKAAELHSNGEETTPLLKDGLIYTGAIGFFISFLFLLFPGFFAHTLFGQEYAIDNLIGIYSLAATFLSLTNVFVMYNLAVRKFGITVMLIPFTALQIAAISVFHSSALQILVFEVAIMALMFVSIVYFNKEDFVKLFVQTTGYRRYPISAYLKVKTGERDDIPTSSNKIHIKEVEEFMPYNEYERMGEELENKKTINDEDEKEKIFRDIVKDIVMIKNKPVNPKSKKTKKQQ